MRLAAALLGLVAACGSTPAPPAPAATRAPPAAPAIASEECLLDAIFAAEPRERIEAALGARVLREIATASEQEAPPRAASLWPAACAPRWAALAADERLDGAEARAALARLGELAPRVLVPSPGDRPLAVEGVVERASALAGPLSIVSARVGGGSSTLAPADEMSPAAIVASTRCSEPSRSPVRPFHPAAGSGEVVFDELLGFESPTRLAADASGMIRLTIGGAESPQHHVLAHDGFTYPRFIDNIPMPLEHQHLLWLSTERSALLEIDRGRPEAPVDVPLSPRPDALAVCGAYDRHSGGFTWAALRHGDQVSALEWPLRGAPMALHPTPPREGVRFVCSNALALFVWREGGAWTGSYCRDGRCRPMPRLEAGDDLELALSFDVPLFVFRGRRTDMAVARTLVEEDGSLRFGEPRPALTGQLRAYDRMFVLSPCRAPGAGWPLMSNDGRTWRVYFDP